MSVATDSQKNVVFIDDDIPPLKTGVYTLTATQTIPNQTPGTFKAESVFVVDGERYSFQPDELQNIFPPNLGNGEFDGVLPHVIFNRRTLPWERSLKNNDAHFDKSPWLALLLFDDPDAPTVQQVTAKDLIPLGATITGIDPSALGTGTLPPTILSYGVSTLLPMGYGETPNTVCSVVDIPVNVFCKTAPSMADLPYLAHIREVDISAGVDSESTVSQVAVVTGNRIPAIGVKSHVFLVSLENFADFLPASDGAKSAHIGSAVQFVRLIVYRSWTFTANNMDQTLQSLLENVNTPEPNKPRITTLRLPIVGTLPTASQVQQALAKQALGAVGAPEATVLVQNALNMGYVPFDHHLRHGGQTVSWYRGPFAPYPIAHQTTGPIATADALNCYNPETGLFDVSYGVAWQLGQLLALQNSGMANKLYQWKQRQAQQRAVEKEQELLRQLLGGHNLFESVFAPRAESLARSANNQTIPDDIREWMQSLGKLQGVPFHYLVPNESLLPAESLRFFYVDYNWIDALVDGACSVGRAGTGDLAADSGLIRSAKQAARLSARRPKGGDLPPAGNSSGQPTGFLLRSQAVAGWPNLRVHGFRDVESTQEIGKVRQVKLSDDVLLCLFDDIVRSVLIQEPPEQLHMGVEGTAGRYFTTLRQVNPPNPGKQYTTNPTKQVTPCDLTGQMAVACISTRTDNQTLRIAEAAATIQSRLTTDFKQTFLNGFTSAEFALEMTKGVVEVEYQNKP